MLGIENQPFIYCSRCEPYVRPCHLRYIPDTFPFFSLVHTRRPPPPFPSSSLPPDNPFPKHSLDTNSILSLSLIPLFNTLFYFSAFSADYISSPSRPSPSPAIYLGFTRLNS